MDSNNSAFFEYPDLHMKYTVFQEMHAEENYKAILCSCSFKLSCGKNRKVNLLKENVGGQACLFDVIGERQTGFDFFISP
jgi:hypothetical protein